MLDEVVRHLTQFRSSKSQQGVSLSITENFKFSWRMKACVESGSFYHTITENFKFSLSACVES